MRHIAIVAAALISTSAFAAGVPATVAQQNAAVASVRVLGAEPAAMPRFKVSKRDFANQYNGSYKLTNGSEIELSLRNSRFYASLDGNQVELVSVTPTTFVSVDSKMAVSFDAQTTRGDDIAVRFLR